MYANRVKETSTTTGTGDLTLAGAVTGFVSFNTAFSTNMTFHYFILHDSDNSWEQGVGYLSASTTFVRDTFIDSSTGSAINFASGGKTIIASPSAGSLIDSVFPFNNDSGAAGLFLRAENYRFIETSEDIMVADRVQGARFVTRSGLLVDQAQIEVMTAIASATAKMAMYRLDQSGDARYRIASCRTNTFDCATTGVKTATLDEGNVWIGPGEYLLFVIPDDAIGIRTITVNNHEPGQTGGRGSTTLLTQRGLFKTSVTYATAFPEPLAISSWGSSSSVDHPVVVFSHS